MGVRKRDIMDILVGFVQSEQSFNRSKPCTLRRLGDNPIVDFGKAESLRSHVQKGKGGFQECRIFWACAVRD